MSACVCPRTDGYRIKRRGCPAHAETDAAYWRDSDRRKFGTDSPSEPTDEFVRRAFAEGARALWPDSRDPGWIVTFDRWLEARVAEFQYNAVEMARKADQAERRAEEAEFHVEQLRDARDSTERRIERAERLVDSWEHDAPDHCLGCGHIHTPDGCSGPPTPSDRWAGVSPAICDCDEGGDA